MPKDSSSPFTPGQPVSVDLFVGRINEIELLNKKIKSAANGHLEIGFLVGERGIGKSSLASFLRYLAGNEMIGIHAFLGGVDSLEEMVRRIFDRLLKEATGTPWQEKLRGFLGNHIREVGLFGITVEFGAPAQDLRRMVHDFAPILHNLVEQMKDEKRGMFIVLDDINGLSQSPGFANWLKSLVDEIATSSQPLPLFLMLVGIEDRRQSLIGLQPSLARVFDIVEIKAWSKNETKNFYEKAFSSAGIELERTALDLLVQFAGGLPVLAHEIGDAAFTIDEDDRIDKSDARGAILAAADIVGRKHLQPQVFRAIRSARYRSILRKLAKKPFAVEFQRSEALGQLSKEEIRVFDNFIRRMSRLGIVARDAERGAGSYRFTNLLHHTYFWLESERASKGAD